MILCASATHYVLILTQTFSQEILDFYPKTAKTKKFRDNQLRMHFVQATINILKNQHLKLLDDNDK